MIYYAGLKSSEGDILNVQYQKIPTWGAAGIKGRPMAGREPFYEYASNIGINVKLSNKHIDPISGSTFFRMTLSWAKSKD
jgi:hypothetical protein